jgi:High potential iron-sulfur protein
MSESLSRREALKGFVLLMGAAGALRAAPEGKTPVLVPLNQSDSDAVARAYHEDVETVDPKESATYQLGQTCSNCVQGHGEDGA